jgi:CheY-like chemotaxis protein
VPPRIEILLSDSLITCVTHLIQQKKETVMRVLIADDDEHVRGLLRELVEELHYEVVECSDGWDAVAWCRSERPDLVIMDIRMPNMDGIEATRRIREMHALLPVIIVTQYVDRMNRESAWNAGASAYFLKDDLSPVQEYLRGLPQRVDLN